MKESDSLGLSCGNSVLFERNRTSIGSESSKSERLEVWFWMDTTRESLGWSGQY